MQLHLIDATFELFRAYYGQPASRAPDGREIGAVRGLMRSTIPLLRDPEITHIAAATDHVIESFRNDLFPGYKTGEGIAPDLWAQFPLAEDALRALGVVVWPMIPFEADDAHRALPPSASPATRRPGRAALARQGSRPVRPRPAHRHPRSHARHHLRRGRRAREVRGRAGVDPRPPGSDRRRPPTASRHPRLGTQVGRGRPRAPTAPSKPSRTIPRRGPSRSAAATVWPPSSPSAAPTRCSTSGWRPCAPTCRWPSRPSDLRWRGIPRRAFARFCESLGLDNVVSGHVRWIDD